MLPHCHFKQLTLLIFFNLLLLCLFLRVAGLDNSQVEVEQEESTNEYHRHEEEEGPRGVGLLVHDHYFGPTFHCDTLKHVEECPEDIIKIRDVKVRI